MNPAFFVDDKAMLALLERWSQHGWLRALDAAFASFLVREVSDAPPLLILAAALASHQLGRGHACLDLALTLQDPGFALSLPPEGADSAAEPLPLPAAVLDGVSLADWQQATGEQRRRRNTAGIRGQPALSAPLLAIRTIGAGRHRRPPGGTARPA